MILSNEETNPDSCRGDARNWPSSSLPAKFPIRMADPRSCVFLIRSRDYAAGYGAATWKWNVEGIRDVTKNRREGAIIIEARDLSSAVREYSIRATELLSARVLTRVYPLVYLHSSLSEIFCHVSPFPNLAVIPFGFKKPDSFRGQK